jgi:hypothetical protein
MTSFTYPTFEQKVVRAGSFRSWWLSSNPVDGHYDFPTTIHKGINLSTGHRADPDGVYRQGGAWLMSKRTVDHYGQKTVVYRSGEKIAYQGFYVYSNGNNYNHAFNSNSESQESFLNRANSYGAQAYAALKPDKPDFEPVVSLLELKDTPSRLQQRFKTMRKGQMSYARGRKINNRLGSLWLAIQFGWIPLFSDTCKFIQAFANRKKRFDQLLRDEGRYVRRRRTLSKTGNDQDLDLVLSFTHGTASNPNLQPVHVTQCYGGGLAVTDNTRRRFTKAWCSGASRYWLPKGPRDEQWKKGLMRKVLGLYIQPNTVYNLIPWTWLGDYFSGLGTFFDAVSGNIADRVHFSYAYLMFESTEELKDIATQFVYLGPTKTGKVTAVRHRFDTRKSRVGASPFGWGLSQESLTPVQASILGALGASRL